MLVGIAIDPRCFGPTGVVDVATRDNAERVLSLADKNAVLVAADRNRFLDDLLYEPRALSEKLGQHIRIRAEHLPHISKRGVLNVAGLPINSTCENFAELVKATRPEIVICLPDELDSLRSLSLAGVEVCDLSGFHKTKNETLRSSWNKSVRLDRLAQSEARQVVSQVVKYSVEIDVLDTMIGREAGTNDGRITRALKAYAAGVVYFADCFARNSPFSQYGKLAVRLITQGGSAGARGYIDPAAAEQIIRQAIADADAHGNVGSLHILFKEVGRPSVFRDRYVRAAGRAYCVKHGLDDVGRLCDAKSGRGPTILDQDCEASRSVVAEIMALPQAT